MDLSCFVLPPTDVSSMVDKLKKKGVTIKDEPGVSLVRLFAPGVGDEKVRVSEI